MNVLFLRRPRRVEAVCSGLVRLALVAALLVSALAAAPLTPRLQGAHAAQLATSVKPDYRGLDTLPATGAQLANTGQLSTSGPTSQPTEVFHANTGGSNVTGVELGADGSVLAAQGQGAVYSYNPNGTLKWSTTTVGTFGNNTGATVSVPVLSSDGNDYFADESGNVYQISDSSSGAGAANSIIFSTPSGAAIEQVLKIGADNTLYFGAADGTVYHIDTSSTTLYTFAPTTYPTSGNSKAPSTFYGEAAVDGAGNLYIVSTDTPKSGVAKPGTLWKLNSSGAVVWAQPLAQGSSGAVLLVSNPLSPTQQLAIVSDKGPEVVAFDAGTGSPVWKYTPPSGTGNFNGSAAVDLTNGVLYQANTGAQLYALNLGTGALLRTLSVSGGNGAPTVDAAGNVYYEGGNGTLYGFDKTGAALFTIAGTTIANGGAGFNSVAIAPDGTLYIGGAGNYLNGFRAPTVPTATATNTAAAPTNTPTNTATNTPTNTPTSTPVPPTATATNTTVPPTNTPTNTATNTATNTPTNTPTNTSTPNATQTAAQQTSVAQTATAQATQGTNLPNCQLIVLPNPPVVQRTGSESLWFDLGKSFAGDTISATIQTSATYPTTATLYNGAPGAHTTITGTPVPGGYLFVFQAGPNGQATLEFPIPGNAPLGKVTVQASTLEFCGPNKKQQPQTVSNSTSFTVEAAQANSSGLHETQSRHRILFRTVQAPPARGSAIHDNVYVNTAPNSQVTTTFVLSATNPGAGYHSGDTIFKDTKTTSSTGAVSETVPLSTTLLVPGTGGRLLETVQANIDGTVVTFKSQKAIREVGLRLILQVRETTRGNQRAHFEIGNAPGKTSLLTVLVLCDANAQINGTATVGSFSGTATATCGPGGRAKLKYNVPNSTTPSKGTGSVTVTSSFRGATKTRKVNFHYSHKPGKRA